MAKCDFCGTRILVGGVKEGGLRFCNKDCHSKGYVLSLAGQVPKDIVEAKAREIHQGLCPKCEGRGPIDVHTSHKIWSLLLMTSWKSYPEVCCKGCGTKKQIEGAVFSFLCGWWGFPWGLIMTPVQVVKNIREMSRTTDRLRPSEELEKLVRVALAASALEAQGRKSAQA